jgi:tRNA/rRNA methyltransferase
MDIYMLVCQMPSVAVVLVKPQIEGNVGAIARAMMNFGLEELRIVSPECEIGLDARRRAMHAEGILQNAKLYSSLDEALSGSDMIVGTSGVSTVNEKKFSRITITPRELADKICGFDGTILILFGQEDFGLDKEAIMKCDILVTIPTSEEYPIMNISHAASVVFYELFAQGAEIWRTKSAEDMEISHLVERFENMLTASEYPKHKIRKTTVMFRRILGRAILSKWEYHTFMGALKAAIRKIDRKQE